MLVNRVVLKRTTSPQEPAVKLDEATGQIISCCLPEPECVAKVYRVKDGEFIPFKISQIEVKQEYESDPFTAEQTALYKKVLYSSAGRQLLNKLKNSRLINEKQIQAVFNKEALGEKIMSNKLVKRLFDILCAEPKFKRFRRVNFDPLQEYCFNTIPLKDLGITKEDVFAEFQQAGLINS